MIRDNRGYTTTEFLFYFALFIFMIFGVVDYWLTMKKVDQVDHLKEYNLTRAKLEGYLSIADENNLISKLTSANYTEIQITASAKESNGDPRILRNVNDVSANEIDLRIRCTPNPKPFLFGMLVGSPNPNDVYFDMEGSALVERVDP
ncbi:MAG: hypothetical protein A4E53_00120 [Pelotomaculum sp. PtaB.Bin104]|nr:MAG: hypothetical protein A4E53_00120 [Pelotomaculum sp. PtaB.Bin104]